ncbi:MAG: hypothetical protein ACOX2F_10760 [bacterium]
MVEKKIKITQITAGVIFFFVAVFIFLFVNLQQDKYNYFLCIYGAEVSLGSKALVKVISRDGEFVPNPELSINGVKSPTALINLRPDLKEISVLIGGKSVVFPLKFSDLENRRVEAAKTLHLIEKELENLPHPAFLNGKTIYLLPEHFRVVSEFETKVHLFCVEGKEPCKEKEIVINGAEKELKNGHLNFTTIFTHERSVNISFQDGESTVAHIPYSGKMFKFYDDGTKMTLASLSDTNNVHIDCYNNEKWIGTDMVSVKHSGTVLPKEYMGCETVQASFNSSSPGTTFAVYSRSWQLKNEVDDPYYKELAKVLKNFSNNAQMSFLQSYNSSFFKTLPLIFSGEILEKEFNEKRSKELNFYWWGIFLFSLGGLVLFVATSASKIKVVEGLDGELVSKSLTSQWVMLVGAAFFYALAVSLLLYLLKNLA